MITNKSLPPQFQGVLDQNENVLWMGRPKWLPFMMMGLPLFILGCIWACFDFFFIRGFLGVAGHGNGPALGFLIPFFALHLFPFWAGILNMLRLLLVFNNTFFAFTNKRLMIRSGFWGTDFKSIDFDRIQELTVTVNPIENMLGVGTIKAFTGSYSTKGQPVFDRFTAIEDPYEVYRRIKQISVDVKTDWNYPNALRPAENPGYGTKYRERS